MERSITRVIEGRAQLPQSTQVPYGAYADGTDLREIVMRSQAYYYAQGRGLYLVLQGYNGLWVNEKYDRPGSIIACLNVNDFEVFTLGFAYHADRIVGKRFGDRPAAEGQEPESYKITVLGTQISWELCR